MEESFGTYLQNGRLMAGLLTADLAKRLCTGKETLKWLEEEDHARLPEPVFVRGFIRHYALEVGLDPDHALLLYREARRSWDTAREEAQKKRLRKKRMIQGLRVGLLMLFLIFFVSFVGLFLVNFFFHGERVTEASLPVPESLPDAPLPQKTAHSVQHLEIRATESTWIKMIRDEEQARSFSMNPGDILEFDAEKTYNLLIGSATGVRLRLNGKVVPLSGASGQAVTLHLP